MYQVTIHIYYPESQFPTEMDQKDVDLFVNSFDLGMIFFYPWIHSVSISLTDSGKIPWFDEYPPGTTFTLTKVRKEEI